jgi:membrane-associated protease RseP (regulator of RpoE activity)
MEDPKMNRSWTIAAASATAGAAALSLGLFLAVTKDTLAGSDEKTVRIVVPEGDPEAVAAFEADSDDDNTSGKGAFLGLSLREDTKSDEGGALVRHVVDGSPAAKAGLKDGDVIVGFGGDIVRGPAKVTEKLRAASPGDKVVLDVRRDGKVQKITVELGERKPHVWWVGPGSAVGGDDMQGQLEESLKSLDDKMPDLEKRLGKMKFYAPGRHGLFVLGGNKPLLGIEMVDTTPDLREVMGGSKDAGVLVGKVLPGSAAEKGGLKVGDLILSIEGTRVSDPGELADAVGKQEGKAIDIEIMRDKKPMRIKAVLPKFNEPEDEPTGPRASVWRVPRVAPVAVPCAAFPVRRRV